MSRQVIASLSFNEVDASTLAGTVAGYRISFGEAGGASQTVTAALDQTSVTVTLDPGTWVANFQAIDASGAQVGSSVISDPLVVTDAAVVMVKVPGSITLVVQP